MASKIIFSVSELNFAAQNLLEEHFPAIWVEGEISNLVRPTSGHVYFSLKDARAQIRCAMFKSKHQTLGFEAKNGLLVQVRAKVSLYPDRGDYQLIIDTMEMAGDGLLRKAYEELLLKLTREGLFDPQWKKPLPALPQRIGVITSPTGAAVRDILSVLNNRFPRIPVFIYPTKVQGTEAKNEIVSAIQIANQHQAVDVLILARGGGSLEDLWPFNEEIVARAIFASAIPIITGVGHEIDFTIADFVADKRSLTPTAAATELLPFTQNHFYQQFVYIETRLIQAMQRYLQHQAQRLDWLTKRIRHPGQQIAHQLQQLSSLRIRLHTAMRHLLKEKQALLSNALRALETVSPLATLQRGYAIVSKTETGEIIRSIREVHKGESLTIRLQDGIIETGPVINSQTI